MDTTKPAPASARPTTVPSPAAAEPEPTPVVRAPKEEALPPYWDSGPTELMGRVENLDPDLRFYWVKVSAHNQQLKRYQGWEPVEFNRNDPASMALLARYGFDEILLNAKGRIQWMDTELWAMPKRRNEAIRAQINQRLTRRSASVRATLDALAEDTKGRSRNRVIPFVTSGTPGEDVFDRTQITESAAASGKAK